MSKENKIKEEELSNLQQAVSKIQNLQAQIGGLEAQKHEALHVLVKAQEELQNIQKQLSEDYGKVSINIQDGTYQEIPEEVQEDLQVEA